MKLTENCKGCFEMRLLGMKFPCQKCWRKIEL